MTLASLAPEIVTRPDPGLARGVWEASPLTLYLAAAAVVVFAALYLAVRLRVVKRRHDAPHSSGPTSRPT